MLKRISVRWRNGVFRREGEGPHRSLFYDTCGHKRAAVGDSSRFGRLKEAKLDATAALSWLLAAERCCCSASCLQDRIIMKTIPVSRQASIPSMKTTLQEKLALIPPTPESPATLDGSLHPSQATSDGR